jgi:hypothetical protein
LKIDKTRIDFDYWFRDHVKKEGNKKGEKGYGWPGVNSRWCSRLKREAFLSMVETGEYNPREYGNKRKSIIKGKKLYIGYAYGEEYRTKGQSRMEEYPLINWKITQRNSLEYCYSKGFDWDRLYKRFKRVSKFRLRCNFKLRYIGTSFGFKVGKFTKRLRGACNTLNLHCNKLSYN